MQSRSTAVLGFDLFFFFLLRAEDADDHLQGYLRYLRETCLVTETNPFSCRGKQALLLIPQALVEGLGTRDKIIVFNLAMMLLTPSVFLCTPRFSDLHTRFFPSRGK